MRFDQHQSRSNRRSARIRRAWVAALAVSTGLVGGLTETLSAQDLLTQDNRFASGYTPPREPRNTPKEMTGVVMNSKSFQIPFNIASAGAAPVEVQLYVATPSGNGRLIPADMSAANPSTPVLQQPGQWRLLDRQPPDAGQFNVRETGDGTFWFATRTVDENGRPHPPGPIQAELKVVVDTQGPRIDLQADADADGRVVAKFTIDDATETKQLTVHYVTDTTRRWQAATIERGRWGGRFQLNLNDDWKQLSLRLRALDQAGNETIVSKLVQKPRVATKPSTRFASGPPSFGSGFFPNYAAPADEPLSANNGPEMLPVPFGAKLRPDNPATNESIQRGIETIETPPARLLSPAFANPFSTSPTAKSGVLGDLPAQQRPQTPAEAMRPLDNTLPPPSASPNQTLEKPAQVEPGQPETPFYRGTATESIPAPLGVGPDTPTDLNQPVLNPSAPAQVIDPFNMPATDQATPSAAPAPSPSPWSPINRSDQPTTRPAETTRYQSQRVTPSSDSNGPNLKQLAERAVVRHSDSNRFSLDFEIEAIGGHGVEAIELYGTTDGGNTWKQWGSDPDKQSPFDIETNGEGVFGFQIVVVAANGLASPRPIGGDAPDIVVVVDQTLPDVTITGARYGEGDRAGSLVIAYRCEDEHLMARPITLSFSETSDGPWTTIAAGLRNLGDHVWPADPQLPRQIYLRVDATDQAGNVGSYILEQPVDTRGLAPRARIRAFRSITSR